MLTCRPLSHKIELTSIGSPKCRRSPVSLTRPPFPRVHFSDKSSEGSYTLPPTSSGRSADGGNQVNSRWADKIKESLRAAYSTYRSWGMTYRPNIVDEPSSNSEESNNAFQNDPGFLTNTEKRSSSDEDPPRFSDLVCGSVSLFAPALDISQIASCS